MTYKSYHIPRIRRFGPTLVASCALLLSSCLLPPREEVEGNIESEEGMVLRQAQAFSNEFRAGKLKGATLSFDLANVDKNGRAVACNKMKPRVNIQIAQGGLNGQFVPVSHKQISVQCAGEVPFDLGIVIDNSGSQSETLDAIVSGAKSLASEVIRSNGRVAITRVSTQAEQMLELSSNEGEILAKLDEAYVKNGWTALYDGIRLAQERVGWGNMDAADSDQSFCRRTRRTGVVVFTDGADNNSADQKSDLGSDGIETSLKDVWKTEHAGVKVPVFTLGLGDKVNKDVLKRLAKKTGASFHQIKDESVIEQAFDNVRSTLQESVQVCADLPETCGTVGVKIDYTYQRGGKNVTVHEAFETHIACPQPPVQGRVATILLGLSHDKLDAQAVDDIVANAANWVDRSGKKKILLVLDDDHHHEFPKEMQLLVQSLTKAGFEVSQIDEPSEGLSKSQLDGYDVVWFSNPGWPVDDIATFEVLKGHVASGKGLVLSGDDMAWAAGHGFDLSELTGVTFKNNGTETCNKTTNNSSRHGYEVSAEDASHPLVEGLEGVRLSYHDDIDHTELHSDNAKVLAWAKLAGDKGCKVRVPVIVGLDPEG